MAPLASCTEALAGAPARLFLALALVLAIIAGAAANERWSGAPELPDPDAPYRFVSKDQDVAAALRFFGKNLNIAVEIGEGVSGRTGPATPTVQSRRQYLDELANAFGLVWFFDGTTLHVSSAGAVDTELFPLDNNDGRSIIEALINLGIYQPRFLHEYDIKSRVFLVSGPPAYVRMVKKAVEGLEKAQRVRVTILRGNSSLPLPGSSQLNQMPETGN